MLVKKGENASAQLLCVEERNGERNQCVGVKNEKKEKAERSSAYEDKVVDCRNEQVCMRKRLKNKEAEAQGNPPNRERLAEDAVYSCYRRR